MKTKIFLILIMIILVVSCTKNNPANPVNVSGNSSGNTEIKDTSSSDNQKIQIIIQLMITVRKI